MSHSFHIPVLGLAFSIDTPIKVAQYGISSVVSIVDDELIERMRAYYSPLYGIAYTAILKTEDDARARRITAYLDLLQHIIEQQISALKAADFADSKELNRYFQLLPNTHPAKELYLNFDGSMQQATRLKTYIKAGRIDVNIMSKVDKLNYHASGELLAEKYSDALAAIRGFARSTVQSAVILSAGMNPRLYSYLTEIPEFRPDEKHNFTKKIILKVSDYRSALIQAKFLAKKGIWVSEFRIESGLNCGGHAFATDGFLLGPILEEFKQKREELIQELFPLYQTALAPLQIPITHAPAIQYTVQGGIGTAEEHKFLLDYYQMDATGWGSPFLLVPEATTVDENTLHQLVQADSTDFYVSAASPLGVPFNNFRKASAEHLRLERIKKGRPGSPCSKKYLVSNTEFTTEPVCTASRVYQYHKLQELDALNLDPTEHQEAYDNIVEKTCLCEGLAAPAYLKYNLLRPKEQSAVSICPGPNLAFFKNQYSLEEMVSHIYGRINLLKDVDRPLFFINELDLYIHHIKSYVQSNYKSVNGKKEKYLEKFKNQLIAGISYYDSLKNQFTFLPELMQRKVQQQLEEAKLQVQKLEFPI